MMNDGKIALSAVVITRDEEERLPGCLESLLFADEIVLIDSGSTDGTVEIAREYGARVYVEDWKGCGPQKQSGIDKCRNDYILVLDADERLPDDTVAEIKGIFKGTKADAYSFRRRSYIGKRWIKHCGWWPDRVTRLFDRNKCRIEGAIHEKAVVRGVTMHLDAAIEHFSFRNYSHMIEKLNAYSSSTSRELSRINRKVGRLSPLAHALWMFFRTFMLKRGFMDGLDGLVVSLLNAGGSFFKYAKYIEKKELEK